MFFTVLSPLLPHLAERFHLSVAGAGLLTGAYAAGAFAAALPSGLLVSRVGVKATTLLGLLLLASASLAFAAAPDVELVFVARLAQGCGCALAWTGGLAWLVAQVPSERRGETIGVALAAALVGALVGPAVGALAGLVGTGPVFLALGVPGFALAAWGLTITGGPPQVITLASFRRAFSAASVYRPALLVLLGGYLLGVVSVLAPLRLATLHWGATGIAALFLVAAGAQTVLNPLLGRWSDKHGAHLPARARPRPLGPGVDRALRPDGALELCGHRVRRQRSLRGHRQARYRAPDRGHDQAPARVRRRVRARQTSPRPPGQLIGSAGGGLAAAAASDSTVWLITAGLCLAGLLVVAFPRRSPAVVDTPTPLH